MAIQLSDHFNFRRLLKFTLPSIGMMVFTSVYGVVDGLFVSNFVGKTPFAAINLVWPFLMLCGGVGFMFGAGGSALVAKKLGEQEPEKANRYFSMMVWVTLLVGGAISAVGIVFMRPLCLWLGADAAMLPHCIAYGRGILAFNVTFMLQNVFQSFLITAEKPKLGLFATVAAGVTNMVLDALLVGVLGWGVTGAAVATGLSQCVGGLLPLIYFLRPNDSLLRLTLTPLEGRPILHACANGASELVSNVTSSVVGMLYNFQLLKYAGENGVAAYGVVLYMDFIFVAAFIGYSIGVAPVVSYHYGAGNHAELKNLLRKSAAITLGMGLGLLLTAQALAVPLSRLFVGYDAALCALTVHAFRVSALVYALCGFNIFSSSFFTALNNGGVSAAISFLRTFVFKLSALLLLPALWALDGVWWATVVAESAAFFSAAAFLVSKRKTYHYL